MEEALVKISEIIVTISIHRIELKHLIHLQHMQFSS